MLNNGAFTGQGNSAFLHGLQLRSGDIIAHYESSNYNAGTGIWNDAGPNSYHLTASGSPTISVNSGMNFVNITSSHYFSRVIAETYAYPITIFYCFQCDDFSASGKRIISCGDDLAVGGGIGVGFGKSSSGLTINPIAQGFGTESNTNSGLGVYAVTFNSASSYSVSKGIKGAQFYLNAANSLKTNIALNAYGGNLATTSYRSNCKIGEIIIYKGEYIPGVQEYFYRKWERKVPLFHYDSSNPASYAIDGGNNITNLYNLGSCSAANAEQTDAARRPVLNNGFVFDGSNDVMTFVGGNPSITSNEFTFFCVYAPAASAQMVLVGDTSRNHSIRQDNTGGSTRTVTTTATFTMTYNSPPDINDFRIMVIYGGPAFERYYINGIYSSSFASNFGSISTRSIGAFGTTSDFTNGNIKEIIMFPSQLKDQDIDINIKNLGTKWGIDVINTDINRYVNGFNFEFGVSQTQTNTIPIQSWTASSSTTETITSLRKHGLRSPSYSTAETFNVSGTTTLDGGPYTDNKAGSRLITFAGVSVDNTGSGGTLSYVNPRLSIWNNARQYIDASKFRILSNGIDADGVDDFMIFDDAYTGLAWTLLIDFSWNSSSPTDDFILGHSNRRHYIRWENNWNFAYFSHQINNLGFLTKISRARTLIVLRGDETGRQLYQNGNTIHNSTTPIGACNFNLLGQRGNGTGFAPYNFRNFRLVNYRMSNAEVNAWGNGREALAALGATTWSDI